MTAYQTSAAQKLGTKRLLRTKRQKISRRDSRVPSRKSDLREAACNDAKIAPGLWMAAEDEDLVAGVVQRFAQSSAGTPAMDRDCSPLINVGQKERVEGFIRQAKDSGIPVLAQGKVADGVPPGGFYVAPTLFGPVPRDHRLACEEVFGPVLAVIPFDDEENAVSLANATDFGLLAGVWTRDGGRQTRMAKRMHCGQVYINCYGAGGGVELPFGGVKRSGHGREKGFLALEEFCSVKTVVQYHGQ